jgi:plasmid replication initiation protein
MKEKKLTVSKSVALTQASQSMSLTEYRLFLYVLAKINPMNIEKTKGEIYINTDEFKKIFPTKDRGNGYLLTAVENSRNQCFTLQDGQKIKVWKAISFDGDYIKAQFSDEILTHITDLKGGYVKYPLEEIRWYTSLPAIRLYEILTQWAKKGEKTYSVNQLQDILGVNYKIPRVFFVVCLSKACREIAQQGRFSIDIQRNYDRKKFTSISIHMHKNDFELIPTKKALAYEAGEYDRKRTKREEKIMFFASASVLKQQEEIAKKVEEQMSDFPIPTNNGATASLTFKLGEWLEEKIINPVAETVQKVADVLPPITPEPVMAVATPTPVPVMTTPIKPESTAISTPVPTSTSSDIPAYVPETYRKALTSKEIAKVLNVFDVRGVFEYLREDILKQAWGVFCASKDEVKAPANYLAGVVRNLLTKIGVDMPNIFATGDTATNAVNTTATVSKYPRKVEYATPPVVRKKGFLDWESNFDTDLFDYDAPDTCCTEAERIRYSKEAKRRSKVSVADMVTQIPLDLYWRLTDEQVDKICDYYENAGVSLESMKTELSGAYQTINIKNVQSSVMGGDAVFYKLWEAMQTHPVPQTSVENEALKKWWDNY